VTKKINNNKNKKIRVCLDFIQNRENTTDLPHVTDTLYHIIVYQVHEYTSIPRREHDSNFKFSVEFILQVTRVFYFSECNPQVRIIK
jgi:hypothetical protein